MTRAVNNRVIIPERKETPLVINGDMAIAQRGTSQTGQTTNHFPVDRFGFQMDNIGTFTSSQSTEVPTGQGFAKSLKLDCTTADASLAAGHFGFISHRFEGHNLQVLKKGTSNAEKVTISFWVKSNKTGNYVIELFDVDNTRQISQLYNISSANTWEQKVMTFAADTTGALGDDNGHSLAIHWVLGAGSTYSGGTLNTSWAANNNANRWVGGPNLADSTDNEWYLTGVQLEIGDFNADTMPEFQFEDISTNLARCQRYCYQEDNSDTYHNHVNGFFSSSTLFIGLLALPVALRSTPSITTSGDYETAGTGSLDASSIIVVDSTGTDLTKMQVRATVSGATAGQGAVLRNKNDADAIFRVDSEL